MVAKGTLAPHEEGADEEEEEHAECAICFLFFKEINTTACCSQTICTDCFLQIKPGPQSEIPCPFCTKPRVRVCFSPETLKIAVNAQRLHGRDIDESSIRMMKDRLGDIASSPPSMFANVKDYEDRQAALAKEAMERFKLLPKDADDPRLFGGADDMRSNLMRLIMASMAEQGNRARVPPGEGSDGRRGMLASLFGVSGPPERERDGSAIMERAARTEELLVLRAMQLSLEEAREREASKGRCDSELGLEDSDAEEENDDDVMERVKRLSLRETSSSKTRERPDDAPVDGDNLGERENNTDGGDGNMTNATEDSIRLPEAVAAPRTSGR